MVTCPLEQGRGLWWVEWQLPKRCVPLEPVNVTLFKEKVSADVIK